MGRGKYTQARKRIGELQSPGQPTPRIGANGSQMNTSGEVSGSMLYRIGIFLLIAVALGLLWPRKIRAALGFVGLIAVLVAVGFLIVVLINLPTPQQ
jgi:hypothetical protein